MCGTRLTTVCAVLTLVCPTATRAQSSQQPAGLCFQARPAARCRSFLVTEAVFQLRLTPNGQAESLGPTGFEYDPSQPQTSTRWYLTADIGWMKNISPASAVGLTAFGGREFGFEETQYGLRARYRRWLGEALSLDVSPGAVFGTGSGIGKPGFSGKLSVNFADFLQLNATLDIVPHEIPTGEEICEGDPSTSRTCWLATRTDYGTRLYAGAGLGSKLGVIAYLLAGTLGILAASY